MKTFKRILIILGVAALVALLTWAAVEVINIASLPTDTMDDIAPMPADLSITVPGFMGYIKPLVLMTLVVVIEQFIEKLFTKRGRRAQLTNT